MIRKSGVDIIGDVPWGTHFCQFYQTSQDLTDILVPYFKEGLENNEFCMWITSEPLNVEDVKKALIESVPGAEIYLNNNQIEILDYKDWYLKGDEFNSEKVLDGWIQKLNDAINLGYDGLRLTGNTFWLEKDNWDDFTDYERDVDAVIGNYRMIAMCTYSLDRCNAVEIIDVINNHEFALIKHKGEWTQIKNTHKEKIEDELEQTRKKEAFLSNLLECSSQPFGVGYPDGRMGMVNKAFEELTGYTKDEIMSLDWSNTLTPRKYHDIEYQKLDELKKTGIPIRYEKEYIRKDGSMVPVELLVHLIKDDEGEPMYYYSFITDISNRKFLEKFKADMLEKEQSLSEELRVANEELQISTEELQNQRDELLIMNQALDDSQKKFFKVFHANPAAITLSDANGRYIDVNASYSDLTGYSRNELIGSTSSDLRIINEEQRGAYIDRLNDKKSIHGEEMEILTKSGEKKFVISSNEAIQINDEMKYISFIYDITGRKKAEEVNKYHALLLNKVSDAVLGTDSNYIINYWNDGAEKMFGYSENEAFGKTPLDLLQPYYLEGEREKILKNLSDQGTLNVTLRLKQKNNNEIIVEVNTTELTDDSGITTGYVAAYRDITKRKKAEEALEESEKRYRGIIDNIQDAYIRVDNWGIIILASPSAAQMYGFDSSEDMVGIQVNSIYKYPEERKYLLELLKENGSVSEYEISALKSDGTVFTGSVNAQYHYDEHGQINGTEAFVHDISVRKQAEEEIKRHIQILDGINRLLNEALTCDTEEAVATKCLEIGEEITGSELGFIGEINEKGLLDDIALSPPSWEACKAPTYKAHELIKDMEIVGYWGRTIAEEKPQIVNDPENDPDTRGVPEGHPMINTFLGVPLKQRGKTIGMIALANKEDGYTEFDKENIEVLSIVFVEALMRKRAENEFIASETKYHSLYSSMSEGVAIHEIIYNKNKAVDYVITDVNNAYENILDLDRSEVIGKLASELYGSGEPPYLDVYALVSETGESTQFETYFEPMDRYFRISVVSLERGRFATFFEDITLRKKTEKVRYELASIVKNSDDAIIGKDLEGVITSWNKGAEKIYGYKADEVIGKNISILTPSNYNKELDIMERIRNGNNVYHQETKHITKTGKYIDISKTVSQIKTAEGEIVGISTIARDISNRKKMEGKLRKTLKNLKRSNAELEQFAYVASHDLQEPLRMISSFLQLLQRRYSGQLDSDADDFIEFAVDGASRMHELIEDLLAYSRVMTQGKEFAEVDMEDVLESVLINYKITIDENDANITHEDLPVVSADRSQMIQLMQNIIGNAIKYRSQDSPEVHVSAYKEMDHWIFRIKDNGIGVDPKYHERIFKIFKRLHTNEEYKGTGIGLAITKRIIERHGGQIWIDSTLGEGSTFLFTIPIKK